MAHRPFANGSQYLAFEDRNCCRCALYSDDATRCELMMALARACFDDGTISDAVALGIGFLDRETGRTRVLEYSWDCASFQGPPPKVPRKRRVKKKPEPGLFDARAES